MAKDMLSCREREERDYGINTTHMMCLLHVWQRLILVLESFQTLGSLVDQIPAHKIQETITFCSQKRRKRERERERERERGCHATNLNLEGSTSHITTCIHYRGYNV